MLHDGLQFLWYTISHMGMYVELPCLIRSENEDSVTDELFFQNIFEMQSAIADAIAHWLPEISQLSNRLATSACPADQGMYSPLPFFLVSIRQTFAFAGHKVPRMVEEWQSPDLYPQHRGDIGRFLLAPHLVVADGDRYRRAPISSTATNG